MNHELGEEPFLNGYRPTFPRVKRPEREADHPPPISAEVKNV